MAEDEQSYLRDDFWIIMLPAQRNTKIFHWLSSLLSTTLKKNKKMVKLNKPRETKNMRKKKSRRDVSSDLCDRI